MGETSAFLAGLAPALSIDTVPAPDRQVAWDRFTRSGLPTSREEDWRFTNLRAIANRTFDAAPPTATEVELGPSLESDEVRLVFVDGVYRRDLSQLDSLPVSVVCSAGTKASEALRLDIPIDSLLDLNTALVRDAIHLRVPAGVRVEPTVRVQFLTTATFADRMTHPRVRIELEEGATATVVEDHVGTGPVPGLVNAVTSIDLADHAQLDYAKWGREPDKITHLARIHAGLHRDSVLRAHSITTGGSMVRNDVQVDLLQPGAECHLNGLVVVRDEQHVDNHTQVHHLASHTHSHEHYRNVLDGSSRGVFAGRVHVHPDAQKIDAVQSNKNLLLSRDATMNTLPQLEIYADDVKCSHGATLGELDERALFYLRSRGIPEASARNLLIFAFVSEVIDDVKPAALLPWLRGDLLDRLPHEEVLREALG